MTVKELYDKMQAVDILELTERAVKENEKALIKLNQTQMELGLTSEGQTIAPTYRSLQYARFKKQRGGKAPMGIPDLKLTGSFHQQMLMEIDSRSYSFFSTDDKARDLTAKYSDIFGLTKESQEAAMKVNTATLGKLYKQATGL